MNYNQLTGKVITPSDPEYMRARQEYNRLIDVYPAAIVYCYNSQDVINAVAWSKKNLVPLRIRSGGHSYEGYSTGAGALVIDTSPMNSVKVNKVNDTVRVGAGVRLLELYKTLYEHGYAFPGGTCPTVAVSGLVMGGGIGLSSRYLGLTCDSLLDARMVGAEADILAASRKDNPDLFWALRGSGGGNFGVVTSWKFKLTKIKKVTLIQLEWDGNKAARLKFLSVWQKWLKELDKRMSAFGGIYKLGAWIYCFFYGEAEEARAVIKPFMSIPGITLRKIKYVDFIKAVEAIASTYGERTAFKSVGRFVYRNFTEEELKNIIDIIDEAPTDNESFIQVYSMGGAIRDVDAGKTAFYYRSSNYIMAVSSNWQSPKEAAVNEAWVQRGFEYIKSMTAGSYVNFPYSCQKEYELAYYGDNMDRLQKIKSKYDPQNIFSFPQSIR